jgi:hypothetical protein
MRRGTRVLGRIVDDGTVGAFVGCFTLRLSHEDDLRTNVAYPQTSNISSLPNRGPL